MSVEQAKRWLQNHSATIPALSVNLDKIAQLKEDEKHSDRLARIAIRDPALALALLARVNTNRGSGSGKDRVESPLSAISLLGDHVSHTMFENHPRAENTLTQEHQLWIFEQLIERSLHNERQVELWALQLGYKQPELFKVAALLAYLGELFCCTYDFKKYLKYVRGIEQQDEAELFGFHFDDLTEVLCNELHLPLLINSALSGKPRNNPVEHMLYYCSRICLLSERGWYNAQLILTLQEFARTLQMPEDRVCSITHQFAISASTESYVEQAWTPAAQLLLLTDAHWASHLKEPEKAQEEAPKSVNSAPPKPNAAAQMSGSFENALNTIRTLAKQSGSTQSGLVNACLKGLFQDLGLARVSLLMLSADKKQLQNRMSLGLEETSRFRQFTVELGKAGLFRILLQKPQAILITRDSLAQYQKLLPSNMLASILTDNFMAMSLFVGNKPIGIVYADQRKAPHPITADLFSQFKQLISLTSKALTLLAKR
jgi:hypothetical protein